MPWLINAQQVDSFRKNQKNLIILDASWYLNDHERGKREFLEKHIPGARFFDINAFNDPQSNLPHFLTRDEGLVAERLGALGLKPDCKVIFYDRSEYHTSCRALWMLKMFGHPPQLLYVLDGGLSAWEAHSNKVESGEPVLTSKTYVLTFQEKYCRTLSQMKVNLQNPQEQVIDARHAVRYAGGAESRPGVRSGHLPGSFSFPFSVPFDAQGYFLPLEKIRRRMEGIGINVQHPTATLCGSGVTSAVLNFIFDLLATKTMRFTMVLGQNGAMMAYILARTAWRNVLWTLVFKNQSLLRTPSSAGGMWPTAGWGDKPKFGSTNLLRRITALNLEDFFAVFWLTVVVTTASPKNGKKVFYLQRINPSRYGLYCRI